MKIFKLMSVFLIGMTTHATARVVQLLPNGDFAPALTENVIYTRHVAPQPTFYEQPLFIGIVIFIALIIGLVLGLIIARKIKK